MRRIAAAPGDPAGIGYEITAQAIAEMHKNDAWHKTAVVIYAQRDLWKRAQMQFAPMIDAREIQTAADAVSGGIYLIDANPANGFDLSTFTPGEMSAQSASCAHRALMRIVEDAQAGYIEGICTGPIHKGAMRLAGVRDIGHTEMLAGGFHAEHPMTLFITKELRIFFYTRHLSLRQAIDALDIEGLVDFGRRMNAQMHQLGFETPNFAMAALNPHASDGGQFGTEEAEILIPAAQKLRECGIRISDPIGADSVFAQAAQGRYDAVLSLYHDQGHIAAKTYDFERTISATLGLPVLRTSVDHGTAFDIAWTGKAQSISMKTALEVLLRYLRAE